MQSAQGRDLVWNCALACASCNWLLHPASTSAQDGLDPQRALPATCTGCVFLYQLAHLLTCTHDLQTCCHRTLQLALAVFLLSTRHLHICAHIQMSMFCNLHCVVVVVHVMVCDGVCVCVCVCVCCVEHW